MGKGTAMCYVRDMADAIFSHPQLAAIYDAFEAPRDDIDSYLSIAVELGAESVIDLGCGTGVFARSLASAGYKVLGIDPAGASLEVARTAAQTDGLDIDWILGTSEQIPDLDADLVTMTGNVAQVFLNLQDLEQVFSDCASGLNADGHLVFETRDPDARAWEAWAGRPPRTLSIEGIGEVTETLVLGQVELPFVSFTHLYRFHDSGDTIGSRSRLRFHTKHEVTSALTAAGFTISDIREAPDRPGKEMVFIARRGA